MCTAATYLTDDFYFGRTLDYEFSYVDEVTITPRNYTFNFQKAGVMKPHYAIIGVAYVLDNYPLYYDGINEKGLCMAGLNFPDNAVYRNEINNMYNIAQFEFIPWVLGQCSTVEEAKELLSKTNLINLQFKDNLPVAQLHWLISDKNSSITAEPLEDGIKVYDNPVGILTNNPPFNEQMVYLNNFMSLSVKPPLNNFSSKLDLHPYCRGMGAIGLPGDLSSPSRFVRASFTKMNSVCNGSETESICQFFHILGSVSQQRGCCETERGEYEYTIYTSCCNADKGIYYYTTYYNHQISGINMHHENLDDKMLVRYSMIDQEQIMMQN